MNREHHPLILNIARCRAEEASLRATVLEQLTALPFEGFELAVCRQLTAMGYSQVRLLGRSHLVGRNKNGGADLAGTISAGVGTQTIVAQLKQYRRDISRRAVDELRGVVLRTGTDHGILITTGTLSSLAKSASSRGLRPRIELISGALLADLCVRYRVGVVETSLPALLLDEPFFDTLRNDTIT